MIEASEFSTKNDVWACGIIMHILCAGYPPYVGKNNKDIMENIVGNKLEFKKSVWSTVTEPAKDLIASLLEKDPELRPTAEYALQNVFFEEIRKEMNHDAGP